jgi:hypothetical protein
MMMFMGAIHTQLEAADSLKGRRDSIQIVPSGQSARKKNI